MSYVSRSWKSYRVAWILLLVQAVITACITSPRSCSDQLIASIKGWARHQIGGRCVISSLTNSSSCLGLDPMSPRRSRAHHIFLDMLPSRALINRNASQHRLRGCARNRLTQTKRRRTISCRRLVQAPMEYHLYPRSNKTRSTKAKL